MSAQQYALVYIGTVTISGSRGIYASRLNLENGSLTPPTLAATTEDPNFLTTDPSKHFLYCTGQTTKTELPSHTVAGFAIDHSQGTLTPINSQVVDAMSCCHISTGLDGSVLFAADYGNGKAAAFPLNANGSIASPVTLIVYDKATQIDPDRQDEPHVHSINPNISGRYAFVCDFSADTFHVYAIDGKTKGLTLVSSTPAAPGSGPRHLTCHPNGKWIYAIHELNGTISVLNFDAKTGQLTTKQTVSMLPEGFRGKNTTAEIALSPDLRFLYGSNRGHDSLAFYQVHPETGLLTLQGFVATQGQHPRNFTIDPTGRFMLVSNMDSNNVVVFRLNSETGKPEYMGEEIQLAMPMRVEIILPDVEHHAARL